MDTKLTIYIEVERRLLEENPLLPDVLQLKANDRVPSGYRLGRRYIGETDNPLVMVVGWDLDQVTSPT
jgi:hypothetical protein